jgi:hypothetical protein
MAGILFLELLPLTVAAAAADTEAPAEQEVRGEGRVVTLLEVVLEFLVKVTPVTAEVSRAEAADEEELGEVLLIP